MSKAAGLGTSVIVDRAGKQWVGTFKGIKETGELILDHKGQEVYFSSGDVKLRSLDQYSS
jgi:BirA family biotin operon repressor/biotin-[acetyl-CoA-carboxylase] ligase